MMSGIRSKNTHPELLVRRGLFRRGIRYRLHVASLPGHPDLVIHKYKTVVLVHGCFWHAHQGCRYYRVPTTNREFWVEKLGRNKERDARSIDRLRLAGWRVAVVWECATRNDPEASCDSICEFLMGDKGFVEIAGGKRDKGVDVKLR